jgi:hypothetical protein
MKQKYLISTLLSILVASSAFGRDGTSEPLAQGGGARVAEAQRVETVQKIAPPQLIRLGSNRFAIGDSPVFSFQDANRFIADPYIVERLRRGVNMKRAAIGLGIGGTGLVFVGLGLFVDGYMDLFTGRSELGHAYGRVVLGAAMWYLGGASIITSIVLGSVSPGIVRRAIRDYNEYSRAGIYSDVELGVALTPGGLGVQLTF